ncbi:hypothetical protein F4861DRAFT_29741 [Xylaria intraflava]|nr:hypothetical protein F4861DRAFT_29741 [Xylaria intraflava]
MAAKTTSIPRFLLPQYGSMWRTAVRSAIIVRPLNAEAGQVMVRYVSKAATRRPAIANSTASKTTGLRAASNRATAKAAKASAPTRPPKTTSKAYASKPASHAPASEPIARAAAPEPTSAAPKAVDPSKPIVLEKPERFNPPSHGARLPRSRPKHYGGPMGAEEVRAQSQRTYPGLPPPPNTWSSWFINSRWIHTVITVGTLTSLALYTFITNFKSNSPFAEMIPPISEFPGHPFQYISLCIHAVRLHEEHESAQTAERRRRKIDDVAKRNEYRRAHGLEPAAPGLLDGYARPAAAAPPDSAADSPAPVPDTTTESTTDGKRKKFMGIF